MSPALAISRLVRVGEHRLTEPRERRRLRVNNALALAVCANTLVYVLLDLAVGASRAAAVLAVGAVGYLVPVALNRFGWYRTSRFVLVTIPTVTAFVVLDILGMPQEVGLFLVIICAPLVICPLEERGTIAWGMGFALTARLTLALKAPDLLKDHLVSPAAERAIHTALLAGIPVLLVLIVLFFVVPNARAEGRLHQSQAALQTLLDQIGEGVTTLDERGCIGLARSARFDEWFHAPAPGTPLASCLAALDPVVAEAFIASWKALPWPPQKKDLETLPAAVTTGPCHHRIEYRSTGEAAANRVDLMVIVSDVTAEIERRHAEEVQRTLQAELAQAQKLESVGRLASGVAHEINTPIQYVGDSIQFVRDSIGDLRTLLDEYRQVCQRSATGSVSAEEVAQIAQAEEEADLPYLLENVPKALDRAADGVGRVATIVRSMKEFAHPDAREKAPADLNRALLSTITVASHAFKPVADVETHLAEIPPVPCYLGSLNQVFLNLIVNAADAIVEAVAGSGRRGRITIRTIQSHDDVLISIGDDGPGIPEAVKARIFDQFFTTKPVGKGTGQGLAIARRIVASHGGQLWFESQVGLGTTFFIRLPIAPAAAPIN